MLYAPKSINTVSLTGVPLFNGITYVYIQSYQYYPNGSYGIFYSTGLFQYVPLVNVTQSSFNMFQWAPAWSANKTLIGNFFSPNYGYTVTGGLGFFWNGTNWT